MQRLFAILFLASTVIVPNYGRAELIQTSFFNGAPVICESVMDSLTDAVWGKPYNMLDAPVAMCARTYWDFTVVGDYFFLDKVQGRIRTLSSRSAVTGVRVAKYQSVYGNGVGSGVGQYRRPGAITVGLVGGGSCTRYVFVADSGNNRIQKLRWDICASPQPVLSHEAYIYQGTGNGGYGALNNPHDVDYCDLYTDASATNDFLVVADTFNHRVLAMRLDGTVLWSVGGQQGGGANQFSYPYAVTAQKIFTNANDAYVYVADRGNNRVVWLRQNNDFTVSWLKTLPLPGSPSGSGAGFPVTGLDDIEVDAANFLSGVWVSDSQVHRVYQLDEFLNNIVTSYDNFGRRGCRVSGLETTWGELCVLSAYTRHTGAELFQIRASIEGMAASPNPFDPQSDWMTVSIPVTRGGNLRVWVESHPGGVRQGTLLTTGVPAPTVEYALWDGHDSLGVWVDSGLYRVIARMKDQDWAYSDRDTIIVKVQPGVPIKVLATRTFIEEPDWAPNGQQLLYSGGASGGFTAPLALYRVDVDGTDDTPLTSTTTGRYLDGAWSPDGSRIAYSKDLISGPIPKRALYVMSSDGSNETLLSDLTSSPDWFREEKPRWIDGGERLSYTHARNGGALNQLNSMRADGSDVEVIRLDNEWISGYGWSPDQRSFAFVSQGALESLLYRHDILDGTLYLLSHDDPAVFDHVLSVDWSPNGEKLVALQNSTHFGSRWDIFGVSPRSGDPVPFIGLGSPEGSLRPGVRFSPDGTKVAFPLDSYVDLVRVDLIITDVVRGSSAFPSVVLHSPASNDTLLGVVQILGTVADNVSVVDTVLSSPTGFNIQWGSGLNPASWSSLGITKSAGPVVEMGELATWNTGLVPSGWYTLRLSATDGVDSNVVVRPYFVRHKRLDVDDGGGTGIYTTIQSALSAVDEGDTVYVHPGAYTGPIDLRASIHVIATDEGVTVSHPDAGFAMRAIDLEWPTRVVGFTVTHPTFTSSYGGIFVDDSEVSFHGCRIENVNAGAVGGGVRVRGNSYVTFRKCDFINNKGSDGGAVALQGIGSEKPVGLFVECLFAGNQAPTGSGGAVWVQYNTVLDTTKAASEFHSCVFSNNSASVSGSAVLVDNCQRPKFRNCAFVDNYLSSSIEYTAVLEGSGSGADVEGCTFAGNDRFGTNTSYLIGLSGFSGIAKPVRVKRSLFALNPKAMAIEDSHETKYSISNSDFFGNQTRDDYWLTHGTNNLNANPAFCDASGGDYELMAFSPCAEALTTFGRIGAFDVGCVPTATVTTGAPVAGCPAGDGGMNLVVTVNFDDAVITRDIGANEITMGIWDLTAKVFEADGVLSASAAATAANGYTATIQHSAFGYCSANNAVDVLLNGFPLATQATANIRSWDLAPPWGIYSIQDFSAFTAGYPVDPAVNDCRDYDNDNKVGWLDFTWFTGHYLHSSPYQPANVPAEVRQSSANVALQFTEEYPTATTHRLYVDVDVENFGDVSLSLFALGTASERLAFAEWRQAENAIGVVMFAPNVRDGMPHSYLGVVVSESFAGATSRLGQLVFDVVGTEPFEVTEGDFILSYGEVLLGGVGEGGVIAQMSGVMSRTLDSAVDRIYYNRLEQNFPNPFNPTTTLAYSLKDGGNVSLTIYDVAGRRVRELVNERRDRGAYKVTWDGQNDAGQIVASGVYFYKLIAGSFTDTKKMTILK